ncbi:MAG: beta-lactamase family protein [Kangiellaceae bacterium]|nr:beta-lactamase family protein [Kangiellaceae bacterium]
MQMWKKIVLSIVLIAIAATAFFWSQIIELNALRKYVSTFAPENIDRNFRELYIKYPAIDIKATDDVYPLKLKSTENVFPESFDHYGEQINTNSFITRTHTTGIMVMHKGELIYEMYDRGNTAEDYVLMASVSKSMLSMLVGIAVEQGHFKLEEPVTKYVPLLKNTGYDNVSIKDTLEMSTGIRWSEEYANLDSEIVRSLVAMSIGSLDLFAATSINDHAPGSKMHYASINTHVLGMVIRGATGLSYEQYFHDNLWSKIGAESEVKMLIDSDNQPQVYGGVNIRLRDMYRFGKLYLDQGRNYLGEQVIPEKWVEVSGIPDAPHLMPMDNNVIENIRFGYKYHWWVPPSPDGNDYAAIGIFGQFIYINPKREVMIVKTSAYPDYFTNGGYMNLESLVAFQAIAKHLTPDSDLSTSVDPIDITEQQTKITAHGK